MSPVIWLKLHDCHDIEPLQKRQKQLQSLQAGFSCLNLSALPHSALVLIYLEGNNLLLTSVASYACIVVITAVEQMNPAFQYEAILSNSQYFYLLRKKKKGYQKKKKYFTMEKPFKRSMLTLSFPSLCVFQFLNSVNLVFPFSLLKSKPTS